MADEVRDHLRPGLKAMHYAETLMYGRYQKDLGEYAKQQAKRLRQLEKQRRGEDIPSGFRAYTESRCRDCKRRCGWLRLSVLGRIGEDWVFLTLLGVIMALLSFLIDYIIELCQTARKWMYQELAFSVPAQYVTWILFCLIFISFSTGFTHIVGPNAIGSGIPEMKTILRGVVLKEYLTVRTLISKVVGLITSLGCGLPIGKEGPFVHVASIAATILGKCLMSLHNVYESQSRNAEMLAAACAVGVACTFAAPIGGVLFSIEVTATYFAVRNYWRAFYSAVCGALTFRLLAIWFKDEETITALFKTSLRQEFPFDPVELLAFAVTGVVCGFAGALFVFTHRKMVQGMRKHKRVSSFLQKNRFLFPSIVVFVIMTLMFPPGFGQMMAGELTNHEAVNELFSNWTWSEKDPDNMHQAKILKHWGGPFNNIYLTLTLFIVMRFWMSALSNTLPVAAGVFIPVFTIGGSIIGTIVYGGAAFGRLMGESMAVWFPNGIGGRMVVPGGYAIVGAAALSGSVTHTISTSVIVFELTGQMGHVLPCVVAVLIANAIAHTLQPSIYDSMILIKNLPYLPDIIQPNHSKAHQTFVESFMVRDLEYLTTSSSYLDASRLLDTFSFRAFPLVDSKASCVLLGSIQRVELESILHKLMTRDRKLYYFQHLTDIQSDLRRQRAAQPGKSTSPGVVKGEHSTARVVRVPSDTTDGVRSPTHDVFVDMPDGPPPNATPSKKGRFNVTKVAQDSVDGAASSPPPKPKPHSHSSHSSASEPEVDLIEKFQEMEIPVDPDSLTAEQQFFWEEQMLMQPVNFDECQIDPAPFQLVEKTSLYKCHSLFSLLGLHHAYVTNMGRLVGIIGMHEVRMAVQGEVINTNQRKRDMKRQGLGKMHIQDDTDSTSMPGASSSGDSS